LSDIDFHRHRTLKDRSVAFATTAVLVALFIGLTFYVLSVMLDDLPGV
jgi:hypothetical protein